ncbi:MAG: hypothetical protein RR595_05355 [Lysinibacillus sp.]
MSLKDEDEEKKEDSPKKKEHLVEIADSTFTLGIFSFIKNAKLAKTNPKKAYLNIFIPVIGAIILYIFLYFLYDYLY